MGGMKWASSLSVPGPQFVDAWPLVGKVEEIGFSETFALIWPLLIVLREFRHKMSAAVRC